MRCARAAGSGIVLGGHRCLRVEDTFEGRSIVVRYVWSDVTPVTARWEQSFSDDGGRTWETNWTVEHSRLDENL